MAILNHVPKWIGTRDNICIYFSKGRYIQRSASSLTGKRVKKDPAFAKTMRNAGILAEASKLASQVYRAMPAGKQRWQYRVLTARAMKLLKQGFKEEEITRRLTERFRDHNFKK